MKKLFSFLTAILFAASMMAANPVTVKSTFTKATEPANDAVTDLEGEVTWSIATEVGAGAPSYTTSKSTVECLKFGNSKSEYFSKITFSTDYFKDYNVTSVALYVKNNGSKVGTLTATQGKVSIGSVANESATNAWNVMTATGTKGKGGTLTVAYEVEQASYISYIEVQYETSQGGETQPTTQDLYLKLSSDWAGWPAKYAVYYFNDTENGWSEFMTEVEGEDNTYTATIPVGYSKVIFVRLDGAATEANWDNKWSQTVNLTIPENKNHFTVTSGGTGSECDGVWAKYPVVPTYYVAGTMTKWGDEMVEMNEGSYTFEGLAAGKYEIKVVDNNSNWLGFDKLNTTASNKNVYGEGTGNIKFVLGEEGDVTVAYDGAKITVTGATIVAPTTVFTVTVPEGTEKAFIAGNFTKWAPVEMTLKEEGVFTYSFAGDVADTASYKYLAGPDWKYVEVNADDSEADNRGYKEADEVAKWKAVPVALKYAKVTKAPINWTGHYIISFGDLKPHMAISADGKDLIAAADAPAFVDGDTISLAEGYDVEIRFSETAGAYTIKLPSEKYIKIPGSNAVNEDETAMALYLNYFKGTKQEGVQIADKNDFTSTGTRMIYKNNNNYRSYTDKIDGAYVLPTLYRLVDEAFDCQDGPYAILVNGKDVEETVAGEEFDGYKQYVAYLSLTKGDSIQLINTSCGATWLPAIEEGGMSAHFKKGVNAATIDTTGCFDLYIKMKEGDDKLYIGAGICADDTVRYYVTGIDENWDAQAIASKQDTLVLSLKAGDYRFKVLPDGSWDGAIKGYDELTQKDKAGLKADNDRNICFTLKEDAAVTIVYNDTVFTVTGKFYVRVPEYKDLYLVPGVWAKEDAKIAAWIWTKKEGHEMQDQWTAFFAPKAEGNDTLTAKIDAEADSIVFVRFNKTAEAPSWEEKDDFRWNSIAGDTIDYVGLTYTITDWYAGTWKKYEPILYYIAGEGEGLGWDAEKRIAAKQDTTVLNLKAGDYKLKVVVGEGEGAQWKGFEALTDTAAGLKPSDSQGDHDIAFTLKEDGEVKVVYNDTVFTVTGKFYVRVPEYKDLYLVPGVWAEADAKIAAWIYTRKEGAEMADQWTAFFAPKAEGNDTLTAKIDSEADSILFVRFNKTVETPAWSDEEGVIWNRIAKDSIDYTSLTYTITGWATGTWDVYVPETPAKFYITGDSALVVNAGLDKEKAWAPNAIKVTEDSYTFENLAAGDYKLKVTDGAWSSEETSRMNLGFSDLTQEDKAGLTTDDDNNICFTLKEAGNVIVTCKKVEGVTTFTVTGKFYVPAEPEKKLPKVGLGANFNGWNWGENLFTPAKDSLTASIKVTLGVTDTIQFKIVSDGNWLSLNGEDETLYRLHRDWNKAEHVNLINDGRNFSLVADAAGEYTFTWTYADSTLVVTFPEKGEPTLADGYYLVGTFAGVDAWTVTDLTEDKLFVSIGIETGEYALNVTLAKDDKFKVVRVEDDAIKTWYPAEGADYTVDADHAGAKTIYFRPGYNGNEDWHAGCIYVAPNSDTPTGINAINADAKAVKVIRNGQLLIIKGEKTYNGLGTLVR